MGNTLGRAAAIDFGIQWAAWVPAALLRTEKFYDITVRVAAMSPQSGSVTTLLLAYLSLRWGGTWHQRQTINSGLAAVWAARLGVYLFSRILKDGSDRRFNRVRDNPSLFLFYWTMQGVWVFMNLLPTLILNAESRDRPLTTRDRVGWAIWAAGFLLQVLADHQKSRFRANPLNKGEFINSGLWAICRHPNYLGEILMWTGLYVSATSVMSQRQLASVVSPLFVIFMLTRVSGIPLLEKSGLRRWGDRADYQQYLKNTAKLLPFVW